MALAAGCASLSPQVRQKCDAARWTAQQEQDPAHAKGVIVVDIDDTIMKCSTPEALRLLFGWRDSKIEPIPEAADAVRKMQNRWSVMVLTARPASLRKRTLQWLDANDFPGAPVIFSPKICLTAQSEEKFKKQEIRRLRTLGLRPIAGIGDSAADAAAYLANDMRALIILDGPKDRDRRRLRRRLAADPSLQQRSDRLLLFDQSEPTPVWERVLKELETERGAGGW